MKNANELFNEIDVAKSNRHYRLGDLIYRRGMRWLHDREVVMSSDLYTDTFLKYYLSQLPQCLHKPSQDQYNKHSRCYGIDDINILSKAVNEYIFNLNDSDTHLSNDTLYVYIRSGDIVQQKSAKKRKQSNIFNVDRIIQQISSRISNIKTVSIVTSMHFGDNRQNNSHVYTDDKYQTNKILLEQIFNNIIDKFSIQLDVYKSNSRCSFTRADMDLFKLSTCKNVICEPYGGFSDLVMLFRCILQNKCIDQYRLPTPINR